MTKLPSEFSDPEQSYRRGYQHGAWDVFDAVRARLSDRDQAALKEWFQEKVAEWRLDGMQGESVRGTGMNPFPPGVSPPRQGLHELDHAD